VPNSRLAAAATTRIFRIAVSLLMVM
jgi:hypothetical protein